MSVRRCTPRYRAAYVSLHRTDRSSGADRGRGREDGPRPMAVFDHVFAVTYPGMADPLRGIAERPRPVVAARITCRGDRVAEHPVREDLWQRPVAGSIWPSTPTNSRCPSARRLREIDDLSDSGRAGMPEHWGELLQRQPYRTPRAEGPRYHDGASGPRTLSSHEHRKEHVLDHEELSA